MGALIIAAVLAFRIASRHAAGGRAPSRALAVISVLACIEAVACVALCAWGAGTKPATVETGAEIQVPLFLNTGDKVKVDTRSGSYISRVND